MGERLTQIVAKLGENMVLRHFARVERDGHGLVEGYAHPGNRIGVLVYVSAGDETATRVKALAAADPFLRLLGVECTDAGAAYCAQVLGVELEHVDFYPADSTHA